MRLRTAVLGLVLATNGCFGVVRGVDGAGGVPGTGSETVGPSGVASPVPTSSGSQTSLPAKAENAGPAAIILSLDNVDDDGAVAADDVNVYWNQLDAAGDYALLSCPNSGCSEDGPTTLASPVYAGSVVGEIVPAAGLVFFQTDSGEVVDCPSSGCGAGPTRFAGRTGGHAALATDGTALYWVSGGTLYSCPLGATCTAPFPLASTVGAMQIAPSDGALYWVDDSGTLMTVPVSGGRPASPLCSVPLASTGYFAEGSLAVVDGYAYISAGLQPTGRNGGLFRCPLSGGGATMYASDPLAMFVESDGESVFWMSGQPGAVAQIYSCAPGPSCASPVTFLAPTPDLDGFALVGSFVYSVSSELQRTVKM